MANWICSSLNVVLRSCQARESSSPDDVARRCDQGVVFIANILLHLIISIAHFRIINSLISERFCPNA